MNYAHKMVCLRDPAMKRGQHHTVKQFLIAQQLGIDQLVHPSAVIVSDPPVVPKICFLEKQTAGDSLFHH
jgi:hypothetical protein